MNALGNVLMYENGCNKLCGLLNMKIYSYQHWYFHDIIIHIHDVMCLGDVQQLCYTC